MRLYFFGLVHVIRDEHVGFALLTGSVVFGSAASEGAAAEGAAERHPRQQKHPEQHRSHYQRHAQPE